MSDDGNPAVFVGTMLETGNAVALCDECLVGWTAALLNLMTGVDPTPFLAAISEDAIDLEGNEQATPAGLPPEATADEAQNGHESEYARRAEAADPSADVKPSRPRRGRIRPDTSDPADIDADSAAGPETETPAETPAE
jgi:hypothetical protein